MDTTIDDAQPDNDESSENEFPVPLDSLSVSGTPPQVGDTVEAKVGGKVTRIEGDTAYVTPETVNGQPLPKNDSDEPDERDQLEKDSANAGEIGSGGY